MITARSPLNGIRGRHTYEAPGRHVSRTQVAAPGRHPGGENREAAREGIEEGIAPGQVRLEAGQESSQETGEGCARREEQDGQDARGVSVGRARDQGGAIREGRTSRQGARGEARREEDGRQGGRDTAKEKGRARGRSPRVHGRLAW